MEALRVSSKSKMIQSVVKFGDLEESLNIPLKANNYR